jgi:hypothetical protein
VLILGTPCFKGINQCAALAKNIIGFFSPFDIHYVSQQQQKKNSKYIKKIVQMFLGCSHGMVYTFCVKIGSTYNIKSSNT